MESGAQSGRCQGSLWLGACKEALGGSSQHGRLSATRHLPRGKLSTRGFAVRRTWMRHLTPTSGQALDAVREHIDGVSAIPGSPRSPVPILQAYKAVLTGTGSLLPHQPLVRLELASLSARGLTCVLLSKALSTCHQFQARLRRSPGSQYPLSHVPHPLSQAQAGSVHRPELLTPTQLQSPALYPA